MIVTSSTGSTGPPHTSSSSISEEGTLARNDDSRSSSAGRPPWPGLIAVAVCSLAVSTVVLADLVRRDGVFLGSDGPFAGDQLQYLSWIRESGEHGFVRNMFNGQGEPAPFVHPMFLLSGLLWRAGVPLAWTLLIWKPIALGVLITGGWAFVRRHLGGTPRLAALALAIGLLSVPPALALSHYTGGPGVSRDIVRASPVAPAITSWGYYPTTLAVGLLALYFVGLMRCWEHGRASTVIGTSLLGFAAAWIHPWEGLTGVFVAVTTVALSMGRGSLREAGVRRRIGHVAVPLLATTLPLLYYVALERWASAWAVANAHQASPAPEVGPLVLALGPLVALGALAGVGDRTFGDWLLRAWPVIAVLEALFLGTTAPPHFLTGITLPLAVLAVQGIRRRTARRRAFLWAAVAASLLVIPGTVASIDVVRSFIAQSRQPHVIDEDEERALSYLEQRPEGNVLASPFLSSAVPAVSGQPTWAGHPNWTRAFVARLQSADNLFAGSTSGAESLELVRRSRARYLLAGCGTAFSPSDALADVLSEPIRFGCAVVYEVERT